MSALAVYRDLCIGAGQCVLSAPDYFDQDDDGLVVVLVPFEDEPDAAVLGAIQLCPSGALRLHDQAQSVPLSESTERATHEGQ